MTHGSRGGVVGEHRRALAMAPGSAESTAAFARALAQRGEPGDVVRGVIGRALALGATDVWCWQIAIRAALVPPDRRERLRTLFGRAGRPRVSDLVRRLVTWAGPDLGMIRSFSVALYDADMVAEAAWMCRRRLALEPGSYVAGFLFMSVLLRAGDRRRSARAEAFACLAQENALAALAGRKKLVRILDFSNGTFRIGEMATALESRVVGQAVGLLAEGEVRAFYGGTEPVNRPLARCFETIVPTIEAPADAGFDPSELPLRRVNRSHVFLRGFGAVPYGSARALLRREWERQGRGPILSLPDDIRRRGDAVLARHGIRPGDRIVGVHVREPGYLGTLAPGWEARNGHRNADIATYVPAIEAIVQGGARVVRLGDPTMTPLPAIPGVVDYAVSDWRSPELDVYLCARSSWFLGTTSGLFIVASLFGVPCVLTNWTPLRQTPASARDRWIFKLARRRDGSVVDLDTLVQPPLGDCMWPDEMEALGVSLEDNDAQDILDLVAERMEESDEALSPLQAAAAAIWADSGVVLGAPVGRRFLERHGAGLLPHLRH